MFPIHEFDIASIAFPGMVLEFMPRRTDIPHDYKHGEVGKKYLRLFNDMFFSGLSSINFTPRVGIDTDKAWIHLRCIAGSFEPKHEHKEEAFAWLCDQWFENIAWRKAEGRTP